MGRFDDRTTRLARRQESDAFRNYVMPTSWLLALAGVLGLVLVLTADGLEQMSASPAFPILCALFASPAVIFLLRLARGHFSKDIREL